MFSRSSTSACLLSVIVFASSGCSATGLGSGAPLVMEEETPAVADASAATSDSPQPEFPQDSAPENRTSDIVTIGNDKGGYVVDYALRTARWEATSTQVRFAGRCQSACTLYLTLPVDQLCILPGASFTFHMPVSSRQRAQGAARDYLLDKYPSWVIAWLDAHGGLSPHELTMGYQYASQYLRPCKTLTG
jgi:hypothetical protein